MDFGYNYSFSRLEPLITCKVHTLNIIVLRHLGDAAPVGQPVGIVDGVGRGMARIVKFCVGLTEDGFRIEFRVKCGKGGV